MPENQTIVIQAMHLDEKSREIGIVQHHHLHQPKLFQGNDLDFITMYKLTFSQVVFQALNRKVKVKELHRRQLMTK